MKGSRKMNFIETLRERILIGDGAMGTYLYSQGIQDCFEHLNLTNKELIQSVHRKYVEAGAHVIQTNTYAANRLKLAKYNLEDKVKEINIAAVQLARETVGDDHFVLGTIGGIQNLRTSEYSEQEIIDSFKEQINYLLNEEIDGLIFETFYHLEELKQVIEYTRKISAIPIVAQVSLGEIGVLYGGTPITAAFNELVQAGADVVGLNCRMGPYHMIRSFEEVPLYKDAFLSAYPNASLPDYRDGRLFYQANTEYFAECAHKFRNQGIRLLGGCCGTTPDHIRAMADALKGIEPINEKTVKLPQRETIIIKKPMTEKPLSEIVAERPSVICELDPPKKLSSIEMFMEGAKKLHLAGVDAVTMADNSLASPRIDNMALGAMMKERIGIRPLVHITCRDRNLIGLQSHLMGLASLGINDVLAITGDPTKVGDFPGATSVYDLTSFDLIRLIKQLNQGVSFSGKSLGQKTNFNVAAAFNPNVRHLEKAVARMEKKIASGADYFMTQPIYSIEQIEQVHEATKHINKPIYIGIMPLTSSRNAQFLHNEVPGIKLTDDILERMERCGEDKQLAEREGLAIAKSLIDAALQYFHGIYLITPFLRYDLTVELTSYIRGKVNKGM